MKMGKKRVVIVGTGMADTSYAYSLLNQSVCDGLVLIDVNRKRMEGETMDINHDLAFANTSVTVCTGDYSDCSDTGIVVICAGAVQKRGKIRLNLLKRNTQVFRSIIGPVTSSGFNRIFLVATNPVDIMIGITCTLSGFNPRRALGDGVTLDTAGLRCLLEDHLEAGPRNVHAYAMGKYGDNEFVPWSQALLATKLILELCSESGDGLCHTRFEEAGEEVCITIYRIIEAKNATYYGIGMALTRITKAILGDEHSVLIASAMLRGEYGQGDAYVGVPCTINQNGIQRVLPLLLTKEELEKLGRSCDTLRESYEGIF